MLSCVAMSATAQDVYDAANLTSEDLNGTARYVGMGGAMEALGADISTIGTNPAGIGVFRHSEASGTMSVVNQSVDANAVGLHKTHASFDQMGFVWSQRIGVQSYINFGFNYHKSRDFNQILAASNRFAPSTRKENADGELVELKGSGLSLQTGIKGLAGYFDKENEGYDNANFYESLLDSRLTNLLMSEDGTYFPLTADRFSNLQQDKGFISEYDFNLSGNCKDRFYWGFTVGIHDVHYQSLGDYTEMLEPYQSVDGGKELSTLSNSFSRRITGQGVDLKAGIIFRPIEESAFRIGAYVHTPVWYSLKTEVNSGVALDGKTSSRGQGEVYKFKYYTPWTFGLSLGHVVGGQLALGATYEYADYSACDMRYITYSDYDGDQSETDGPMKAETEAVMRGVHTLKVGLEYKPDPMLALRLGYNYVSPVFETGGYRNQLVWSPGVYYAPSADFTNWKDTHRITAGIGTRIDNLRLDLAYQYSVKNGDYYPFDNLPYSEDNGFVMENSCQPTSVDFKRHSVIFTIGYTF